MEVLNEYGVPNSKAIIGAIFIQYLVYAGIYLVEGQKYAELQELKPKPKAPNASQSPAQKPEEAKGEDGAAPVDPNDVQLENQDKAARAAIEGQADEDDEDIVEFEQWPFILMVSKNFQRSQIWFMLVASLCAFRAASAFTVTIAYLQVGFRLLQLIALKLKKRKLAYIAYGLSTLFIGMMFFAAMAD